MSGDGVLEGLILRAPETQQERNFIYKSWRRSFADDRPSRVYWDRPNVPRRVVQMPLSLYAEQITRHIAMRIRAGQVDIAVNPGLGKDVIYGFIAHSGAGEDAAGPWIDYVYVARPFRRFGVARAMCAPYLARAVTFTSWTRWVDKLPLPATWMYNEMAKWG